MTQSMPVSGYESKILPLAKYSWASGPASQKARFTEVNNPSLCVVLDNVQETPSTRPSIRLRVILGTRNLETVPLQNLIERSITIRRSHGATHEQLPIFAYWKDASLAFQYHSTESERGIRRLQMRFQHLNQREEVVVFLERLGMSIEEKVVRPSSAVSAVSAAVHGGVTRPHTAGLGAARQDHIVPLNDLTASLDNRSYQSLLRPESWARSDDAIQMPPPPRTFARGYGGRVTSPGIETSMTGPGQSRFFSIQDDDSAINPDSATSIQSMFPKRELPFPRPEERPQSRIGPSRPRSSARELPPLPTPTPLSDRANQALTQQPPAKTKASNRQKRTPSSFYRTPVANPTGSLRLQPNSSSYSLRSKDSGNQSEAMDIYQDATASSDHDVSSSTLTGNQHDLGLFSEPPTNPTNRVFSSDTASPQDRPSTNDYFMSGALGTKTANVPASANTNSPVATRPLFDVVNEHGGFAARLGDAPNAGANERLAAWAVQTSEDRVAMMDNFFISRLEDKNFATLVEDVEACWRRVGLNL